MQAIIFALISYFTWGSGALFEAVAARKINSFSLIFWSYLFSATILLFYGFSQTALLNTATFGTILVIILLGLVITVGSLFYFEGYKSANRALVGTIAQSFPAVTVVLSLIFLGEKTSFLQTMAILIIFFGMFLSMFNLTDIKKIFSNFNKGILFAFIAMVSWGTFFTFIKIPIDRIGWFWPNYITFLLFPLIFIYTKLRKIKIESPTKNNVFLPFFISIILVRIAEFSYNFAINKGLVAIVAPIAGANVTLFVILAFIFFKDPIKKQQIVGIVTTLTGIVVLSLASG